MGARIDRRGAVGQRREARCIAVETEEQRRSVAAFVPAQAPVAVERGGAIVPCQLARVRVQGKRSDGVRVGAQMIRAVEACAGEEGVRRQVYSFGRASL